MEAAPTPGIDPTATGSTAGGSQRAAAQGRAYRSNLKVPTEAMDMVAKFSDTRWYTFKEADVCALVSWAEGGIRLFRAAFDAGQDSSNPRLARYTCREVARSMSLCSFSIEVRRDDKIDGTFD